MQTHWQRIAWPLLLAAFAGALVVGVAAHLALPTTVQSEEHATSSDDAATSSDESATSTDEQSQEQRDAQDAIADAEEEIERAEEVIADAQSDDRETSASEHVLEEAQDALAQARDALADEAFKEAEDLAEEAEDLAKDSRMKYLGKTLEELMDDREDDEDGHEDDEDEHEDRERFFDRIRHHFSADMRDLRTDRAELFRYLQSDRRAAHQTFLEAVQAFATDPTDEDAKAALEDAIEAFRQEHQQIREQYHGAIEEYREALAEMREQRKELHNERIVRLRERVEEKRAQRFERRCERIRSGHAPEGYGAPVDFFSQARDVAIKVLCDEDTPDTSVEVGTGKRNQYIFNQGWRWDPEDEEWKRIRFTPLGDSQVGEWIVGKGFADIELDPEDADEDGFLVAYMCTWTGSDWKCGCEDEECDEPKWQLQQFRSFLKRAAQEA